MVGIEAGDVDLDANLGFLRGGFIEAEVSCKTVEPPTQPTVSQMLDAEVDERVSPLPINHIFGSASA